MSTQIQKKLKTNYYQQLKVWYAENWRAFCSVVAALSFLHLFINDQNLSTMVYYLIGNFLVVGIVLGFLVNKRFFSNHFWLALGVISVSLGWAGQMVYAEDLTPILTTSLADTIGCLSGLGFAFSLARWESRQQNRPNISVDITIFWTALVLTAFLVSVAITPHWWVSVSLAIWFSILQIALISLGFSVLLGMTLSNTAQIQWSGALTAGTFLMLLHFILELWAQLQNIDQLDMLRRASRTLYDLGGVMCIVYAANCRPVARVPNQIIEYIGPRAWVSTLPMLMAAPAAALLCSYLEIPLPDLNLVIAVVIFCNLAILGRYFQLAYEAANDRKQLLILASNDELSNLKNRRGFINSYKTIQVNGDYLLVFDIDEFKSVNDLYGHHTGDALIVAMAEELKLYPQTVLIGRLGGDEFAVLLRSAEPIAIAASELARSLSRWRQLNSNKVYVGVSVGAIETDGSALEAQLRLADQAMISAKQEGKGYEVVEEQPKRSHTRQDHREIVQSAIDSNHLTLHYQPIFRLSDLTCIGAEVLLRMRDKTGALLAPIDFLPVCRDQGQLRLLSLMLPQQFAEDISIYKGLQLHLNLPPNLVIDAQFRQDFYAQVKKQNLPFEQITLEITEESPVALEELSQAATELRELGFRLAIDDFGSAHSSMARLAATTVDEVKIDQSLLRAAVRGQPVPIETAVLLAKRLGLRITVEGIETQAQLDLVRQLNVECVQGYLLKVPVSGEDFIHFINTQPCKPYAEQ